MAVSRKLLVALALILLASFVSAAPTNLNLDLVVSNTTGTVTGNHNATIRVYDAFTGGSVVHTQNVNISLDTNGIGHVLLTNIDLKDTGNYFLTIQGNEDQESNRINITTALYSQRSDNSTFADEANTITGSITESQISDLVHTTDTFNTTEQIQDSSPQAGTEQNISVIYDDAGNEIDYIVTITGIDCNDITGTADDVCNDLDSGGDFVTNDTTLFANVSQLRSNETAIYNNLSQLRGNISVQNGSSETDELQNLISDIGSQDGNFSVDSQDNSFNITGDSVSILTSISGGVLTIVQTITDAITQIFTNKIDAQGGLNTTEMNITGDIIIGGGEKEGHISIEHDAENDLDFGIHIETDYNGFQGALPLVIDILVSNFTSEFLSAGMLIRTDVNDTDVGQVHAYRVSRVGTGDTRVVALSVGPDVDVIHQDAGSFGNMTQALVYDESTFSFTNATGNFTRTVDDLTIFDAVDDSIIIGDAAEFGTIEILLDTAAGGQGINPTFYYSNGTGVWVEFNPLDDTSGFTENGNILWEVDTLTDWSTATVNGSDGLFWVSINRTKTGSITVIEDRILILGTDEHSWDKDGNLVVHGVNTTEVCFGATCRTTIWASGDHVNATNITGNASFGNFPTCTGSDVLTFDGTDLTCTSSGGATGDKWQDVNNLLSPNSTSSDVNATSFTTADRAINLSVGGEANFTNITLPIFTSCTALETSSTGQLICGADDTAGGPNTATNDTILFDNVSQLRSNQTNILTNLSNLFINVSNVNQAIIENITGGTQTGLAVTYADATRAFDFILDAVNAVITDVTLMFHARAGLNVTGPVNVSGLVTFRTTTDSINGFQVLDANGGTPIFNVDTTNERVGIGTSAPIRELHVSGGALAFRLSDNVASTDQEVNIGMEFYRGDNLNRVGFLTFGSSSNDIFVLATDYTAGELALRTGNNVEAIRIDSSGNVGIGTTTPNAKLDVVGPVNITGNLSVGDNILFVNNITGRVGIGTTSPNAKLDVDGNVTIVGNLSVSNALSFQIVVGGVAAPSMYFNGTCMITNSTSSVINAC